MKAILLPRNYLKFPLVTLTVSKTAYKSLQNTRIVHFLRMVHRNAVRENFVRDFGKIICFESLFKPIRVINRTNSWVIWTRTSEDIAHFWRWHATPPKNKNYHLVNIKIFNLELNLKISENDQKMHIFWDQKIFKSYKSKSRSNFNG